MAPGSPTRSSPSATRRAAGSSQRPGCWPSPPRSSGRPSPGLGLRCEEGRGSFEQVALLLQARVLPAQPPQLVTLVARRAVVALVAIALVLAAPVAQRLLRHAEALRQARRAAGAQHLHRLATELRRVCGSGSWARWTPSF